MKKIILILLILLNFHLTKSQQLGGYTIYDYLVTATSPNVCDPTYVTNLPDDSIWVNFLGNNEILMGNFSYPSIDKNGADLLLETGFNLSDYTVSLLLSNGQYSNSHDVMGVDWLSLDSIIWKYNYCPTFSDSLYSAHLILALDFNLDFGLAPSDTVIGIKIIFLQPTGDADFAGSYIISRQNVGINEIGAKSEVNIYPNPFFDNINIKTNENELTEIVFYDVTSRRVIDSHFTNLISFNTNQLAKGIYFYEVRNKDGLISTGKVVKQ